VQAEFADYYIADKLHLTILDTRRNATHSYFPLNERIDKTFLEFYSRVQPLYLPKLLLP